MNLCDRNHTEICYEERDCPLCDEMAEKKELEDQIESLETDLRDAQETIARLEADIEDADLETTDFMKGGK